MQAFADQHRQWTDLRAAIVFDLVRSINEECKAHQMQPTELGTISVVPEMAAQERLLLRSSLKPESRSAIPTEEKMLGAIAVCAWHVRLLFPIDSI